MKKIYVPILALLFSAINAFAGDLINVSGASGIALNGYDTVAFFTEKKPVHGDPGISIKYQGATYLFSSKENRDKFESAPAKYAPQYGGFCAYGASVGALFPVDVDTWQVKNGKLYLNLNPAILEAFNKDFKGNVKKATANWPDLKSKNS